MFLVMSPRISKIIVKAARRPKTKPATARPVGFFLIWIEHKTIAGKPKTPP